MRPERLAVILSEPLDGLDWPAVVIDKATIRDLDEDAINTARLKFKEKNQKQPWSSQIDGWSDITFLDKAGLNINGGTTRAAILLIGKQESAHHMSPHPAQITWKLDAEEKAYEHFGPPFILTTTKLLHRVRNISQKLFPNNQLLPYEVLKFETPSILEGLHNCIAHQDYERDERILVTETSDRLIFENAGGFFEGHPEDYFLGTKTPKRYRNRWLADAMARIGMIDTMGYGIHTMILSQRKRSCLCKATGDRPKPIRGSRFLGVQSTRTIHNCFLSVRIWTLIP